MLEVSKKRGIVCLYSDMTANANIYILYLPQHKISIQLAIKDLC